MGSITPLTAEYIHTTCLIVLYPEACFSCKRGSTFPVQGITIHLPDPTISDPIRRSALPRRTLHSTRLEVDVDVDIDVPTRAEIADPHSSAHGYAARCGLCMSLAFSIALCCVEERGFLRVRTLGFWLVVGVAEEEISSSFAWARLCRGVVR